VSLLSVSEVDGYYGDLHALKQVSVEVAEGETVGIIGANGAGKSTLLRMIAGLMPARSGHITYDGQRIDGMRPDRRVAAGISLVPEGRRVFPSLTVEENLLIGRYAGRPATWTRDDVFDLFPALRGMARRSAAVLSGGEQQALAIGRALMGSPRLLLLDEVSLGLAPVIVRQLYAALPRIREKGTTVLLVEQSIQQALTVSDRIYCLLKGEVALEGRPAELTRHQITTVYFGV
jgi:branched-chain amino acid transport system ATP-binding protein